MDNYQLTVSIVLFNNDPVILKEAVNSVLKTSLRIKLLLIDNSPSSDLGKLFNDERIEYIFNNQNLGFGKAHNLGIEKYFNQSLYHLVLNPDVYFEESVLEDLFFFMEDHKDVGLISPKVLYPDGSLQYLCKLLPSPMDLIGRRFLKGFKQYLARRNYVFEMQYTGYEKIMNVPYLSGCFMFFRMSSLQEIGLFDEKIFMYTEDLDISRRMHLKYRTLYFPLVKVYHHFAKGSHRNLKLLFYAIHGNCIYFNKWGWFFDKGRQKINKQIKSETNFN